MKLIKSVLMLGLLTLSMQTFATPPTIEVNSLVTCEEASSLAKAVAQINLTVGSPELSVLSAAGTYMSIKNYTSSPPTVTKLDNGNIAICVTLTKKSVL